MKRRNIFVLIMLGIALFYTTFSARAGEAIGRISELKGNVSVTRAEGGSETVSLQTQFFQNDRVISDSDGRVKIYFFDDTVLSISPNTDLTINEFIYKPKEEERKSTLSILKGKVLALVGGFFRSGASAFEVKTPTAVAGVRGTFFSVSVVKDAPKSTSIGNQRSVLVASNDLNDLPHSLFVVPGSINGLAENTLEDLNEKTNTIIRVHEGIVNIRHFANGIGANIDVGAGKEIWVYQDKIGEIENMSPAEIEEDLSMANVDRMKRDKPAKEAYNLLNPARDKLLKFDRKEGAASRAAGTAEQKHRGPGARASREGDLMQQVGDSVSSPEERTRTTSLPNQPTPDDTVNKGGNAKSIEVQVELNIPTD